MALIWSTENESEIRILSLVRPIEEWQEYYRSFVLISRVLYKRKKSNRLPPLVTRSSPMDDTCITPPPVSSSVECSEPHTPPRGVTVITEPPTPTVPNNATGQNYVSDQIRRDENYKILSKEISGKVVGPMPSTEFMEFLPESSQAPEYDRTSLVAMMNATTEVKMYEPFVSYFVKISFFLSDFIVLSRSMHSSPAAPKC